MKRKRQRNHFKSLYILIIFSLFTLIGVGYAYLSSNLSMNNNVNVSKYVRKFNLVEEITKDAVLDNEASTYVTSSTGIDFSKISSDTNGKGIYLLASTKDDTNPIYYYRGAVENNNVKFAGFCWKIVRTTETGGVKLIYNGTPDGDGYCTNTTGDSTQIGTSKVNTKITDNAYGGYMYGTPGSSTYEDTHKNTTNSEIKTIIDNWYSTNMTAYTEKLEDTVWCNDRSLSSGSGIGTTETYYGAYNRLYENKTPNLICAQDNDKFTVSEENGNGALTYPVALITADEVAYAGGLSNVANKTYYLYTNKAQWSLSPSALHSQGVGDFLITAEGILHYFFVYTAYGVRPAVSLVPNTIASGDGTSTLPYIIY